ncbi:MAG: hypothetical protein NTY93_02065 [Candidatus Kaiserbacteria bacterium]|nr:hypothetical protein [Candidatus Kaiserbacteria bacterium]
MKNFYLILFFILIAGNIFIYKTISEPHILIVNVLEVGEKGDAILIRTPSGKTLLVDVGPDASILRALGAALPMWQRRIDVIALTSEKTAQTGGLQDVKNRYHIPTPIHFGTAGMPYGAHLTLDGVSVAVFYTGLLNISYGSISLSISSSTPKGVYTSDGKVITKTK